MSCTCEGARSSSAASGSRRTAGADPLRVLFFGTPEFAVPSLRALCRSRHTVVGLVSQPDRARGRGRKRELTPTSREAEAHGVPVLQPEKVGDPDALAWMQARAPDLGVVVAFGQFIPKKVRELPPHRLINGHASLLPRHRGAAPIPYAILEGDRETGVTVMRVEKEMDAGDYCAMRSTPIAPDETAGELAVRLSEIAAELLVEAVDSIAAGDAQFQPQPARGVSFAPKLDKDFGRLDWTASRAELLRRIRAATPWPGANVRLERADRRLRVLRAAEAPGGHADPRSVAVFGDSLHIRAGDGWIELRELQVPGKRPVATRDFLRGARLPAADRVAADPAPE